MLLWVRRTPAPIPLTEPGKIDTLPAATPPRFFIIRETCRGKRWLTARSLHQGSSGNAVRGIARSGGTELPINDNSDGSDLVYQLSVSAGASISCRPSCRSGGTSLRAMLRTPPPAAPGLLDICTAPTRAPSPRFGCRPGRGSTQRLVQDDPLVRSARYVVPPTLRPLHPECRTCSSSPRSSVPHLFVCALTKLRILSGIAESGTNVLQPGLPTYLASRSVLIPSIPSARTCDPPRTQSCSQGPVFANW